MSFFPRRYPRVPRVIPNRKIGGTWYTPTGPSFTLQGYNFKDRAFAEFKISANLFPPRIIYEYTWQGEHQEFTFDCIQLEGHLLAALNRNFVDSIDEDISTLSTILPYVRDWREKGQIKAFLDELREEERRQHTIKARQEESDANEVVQQKRSRFISAASKEELTLRRLAEGDEKTSPRVEVKIYKRDFPRTVTAKLPFEGTEVTGVRVGGHLLAL